MKSAAVAPAELLFKSGAVYTVDGARSWAQAVGVRAGKIVYVGTDQGADAYIGPATRVIDLKGRMLMPAFQDVHIHPISAGLQANSCDLTGLTTAAEYAAAIRKYARAHPGNGWITGGGWLMSAFGPGGRARRELIDAVVPDRPVLLWSSDGHTNWANTKALQLAGITRDTPDPRDGRIDRDPRTGEVIGSLQEGAGDIVAAIVPPPTAAEREAALTYALKLLNGYGITAMQDAQVFEDDLKTYRALERRGELTMRVVAAIWWEHMQGLEQIDRIKRLRSEYASALVDPGTVKIMQDGVLENYTGVLLQPYLKKPGNVRGIPMVEPELLKEAVTRLDAAGFQVHFHAIGDGAVREALDAIEAARRHNGDRGLRDHIAHLELVDPADVPRFRELGVIANFQPLWAYADPYITQLTIPFLGPERSARLYPIGSLYRSGAVIAFGSDWSVSSPNPLEEIQVAVTRMGPGGETHTPFLPGERIGLPEALAAFTINAAYTNRLEKTTGSIEVGKYADLIVLDHNLFAMPAAEIDKSRVLLTLFEGRPVHGDLGEL
ncbi:MAG: amidohydrolase [Proteobacteria bacterium]|nr:amidohydrolase [Pseudomonadota bacterium]